MKKEFPIFSHHPTLAYLDSAATAQKPAQVLEALDQFYRMDYGTVHRAIYRQSQRATDLYFAARQKVMAFLNASCEEEILFTRGTTEGINFVARAMTENFLKPGDEILITEMEHHSNLVPWQMAAKRSGATLLFIPMNEIGVLEWKGKIGPKTKVVALAHMSNVTGTIHPLAEIVQEARRQGALVVVDGAQAAPHLPVDVQALDCDFYAFSGHKCYGPTGIGVLFGKRKWLEKFPPLQGGGDMIEEVFLTHTTYARPPLRFEAGTPQIAAAIGLKAALEWLEKKTKARIHEHANALRILAEEKMQRIPGVRILGQAKEKGAIVTFTIEGIHPLDIATYLDAKEIAVRSGHLCAQPALRKFGLTSAVRASFAAYNTEDEVIRLFEVLEELVQLVPA